VPRRVGPARDRGPAAPGSQLVVIGSSAGGIEALSKVVAGLPGDFPAPIVIAQHLDPRRQSHLGEILARHTSLELRIVEEAASLEDGVIFVVPSNHHVEIADHHIKLRAREANESTPSVDRLLLSAAETYGPNLIAVILTGSGSDGTAGARAVNAAGGTVVIENPKTAAFPSMPQSLPAAIVDVVADLDAIGELLGKLVTTGVVVESVDEDSLEALLSRLRQRSGIDFAKYKRPTILRRLQTRMAATNQPSLATYGRLVAQDQAEYDRLVSSLLIKVTEFFRDTKVWTYLADHVLPGLVEDARRDGKGTSTVVGGLFDGRGGVLAGAPGCRRREGQADLGGDPDLRHGCGCGRDRLRAPWPLPRVGAGWRPGPTPEALPHRFDGRS